MVDQYTNLLIEDIPTTMEYLYYNSRKVRSEKVTQKETKVMIIDYQPSDPLALLIRSIENLQKLAQQVGIPCIDKQLLEKDLALIRNTRDFEYMLAQ